MQRRLLPVMLIMCFGVGCGKVAPSEREQREQAAEEQIVDMRRWEARQRDAVSPPETVSGEDEPMLD